MIPAAPRAGPSLRERAAEVIFGQQTAAGKAFDLVSIVVILASVGTVMLETVDAVNAAHGDLLRTAEWVFTVVFTVEYGFRLWSAPRRLRYATSSFGVVDLVAILPTWLATLWPRVRHHRGPDRHRDRRAGEHRARRARAAHVPGLRASAARPRGEVLRSVRGGARVSVELAGDDPARPLSRPRRASVRPFDHR